MGKCTIPWYICLMKTIVLCGSISAHKEIREAEHELQERGFNVVIPHGVINFAEQGLAKTEEESAERKKQNNLIKGYYEKIKAADMVLVINVEKHGMPGYIGGNTFLEMSFAHVLDKPLYVLNPIAPMPYLAEIEAMEPVVLGGDLRKIL